MSTPETHEVRAQAKWVRTSARKARLVAEHISGRSVPEARSVLAFTPKAAARDFEKVLRSAVANAEANHGLLGEDLIVSAAYVDEGPTLKRWRARARGRVARIRKRTCHITVLLAPAPERPGATTARRRRGTTAEAAPAATATRPRVRRPQVRKPKPEAAPAVGAAQTEEKPKRRAPVRRKKKDESEKES